MDKKILDKMLDILVEMNNYNRWTFGDFKIDLGSLKDYDGEFIWFVRSSGTRLMKIDPVYIAKEMNNEYFRYALAQSVTSNDYVPEALFHSVMLFKADGSFSFITPEYARKMWSECREKAISIYKERTGNDLPTDFKIRIEFQCSMGYVKEQLKYAAQHGDDSLVRCLRGFRKHLKYSHDHKVVICKDFAERSFFFYEDIGGAARITGGIIFHGYPKEGYKQNGSVMLCPSYGWSIHT